MFDKETGFCESCANLFYTESFTEIIMAGATWLVCTTCAHQYATTN